MTLLFLPANQSVPKGEPQGRRCRQTKNVTPVASEVCWAAVQSHAALLQFHSGGVSPVYSIFLPCIWPHVSHHRFD